MSLIVSGINIITCDRVNHLKRSLHEIKACLYNNNYKTPVIVCDDSNSENIRLEIKSLCTENHKHFDIDTVYVGFDEKKEFISILKEALPAELHSAANFFLFGDPSLLFLKGPGGNRNTVLSAFAGKKFLSFDDDMGYNPRILPWTSDIITYTNGKPDLEVGFFPDIENIKSITDNYTGNPFALYDRFVGKQLSELIPGAKDGKVTAAMSGFYGGRWSSRPYGLFFLNKRMRDIPMTTPALYKKTKYNPLGYLQAPNFILSDYPVFFGGAIGIDASEIVPPFFPQTRNEDNIWAALMLSCNKNSVIASLPFSFFHEWKDKKPFSDNDFKNTGTDFGLFMTILISSVIENVKRPEENDPYNHLGTTLIDISGLPDNKWLDMCKAMWHNHVGNTIKTLHELLSKYNREPHYWASDAEKFLDRLKSKSMELESIIPRELHITGSPVNAVKAHKQILYNYGMLLASWRQIWDAITELNSSGAGLLKHHYNSY